MSSPQAAAMSRSTKRNIDGAAMIRKSILASLVLAASAWAALAQGQLFRNGDHVLITPYGGAWAQCTLTSDRLGYTNNYSYMAVCSPMMPASSPDLRPHQYSEERVKSLDDPVARAGFAQEKAQFGTREGFPNIGPGQDTASSYGPPQQSYRQPYPQQYPPPAPSYPQQYAQPQTYGPQYSGQAYPQPAQPRRPRQQRAAPQPAYQPPINEGPPGLGPPPPMDAPARPGYGPAQ